MDDSRVRDVVETNPTAIAQRTILIDVPLSHGGRLPLAQARNLGAHLAGERGADLLVFLDVDCLSSDDLLSMYESASERLLDHRQRPVLMCGAVAYLPALAVGRSAYSTADLLAAEPHTERPDPPTGEVRPLDPRLFWSLSFSTTHADWTRTGGFDEGYVGYGGEDTDFAQSVTAKGGSTWMVGGARAYHQWHPVSDPPVEHLEDIVRNANRFHRRWGWFPMEGWLAAFRAGGLADYDPQRRTWHVGTVRPPKRHPNPPRQGANMTR
jgi:hypothetical protein